MPSLIRLGRILFGVGMTALGWLGIVNASFIFEWTPVPAQLPAQVTLAYVHGIVLITAGIGLLFEKSARLSSLILGTVWLLWTLLYLPRVMANWRAALGAQFELLAMTSSLFLLAAVLEQPPKRIQAIVSRYAFAICLPVFGVVHFLYAAGVASWVPGWLPAHLFWAYFTGIAHCAAGFSLVSGVLVRLSARLFAIMLSSWVLIVHIPRVYATPNDRHEWTTLFIAIALSGAAWIVAGNIAQDYPKPSRSKGLSTNTTESAMAAP